jgi:hypothetical protein
MWGEGSRRLGRESIAKLKFLVAENGIFQPGVLVVLQTCTEWKMGCARQKNAKAVLAFGAHLSDDGKRECANSPIGEEEEAFSRSTNHVQTRFEIACSCERIPDLIRPRIATSKLGNPVSRKHPSRQPKQSIMVDISGARPHVWRIAIVAVGLLTMFLFFDPIGFASSSMDSVANRGPSISTVTHLVLFQFKRNADPAAVDMVRSCLES